MPRKGKDSKVCNDDAILTFVDSGADAAAETASVTQVKSESPTRRRASSPSRPSVAASRQSKLLSAGQLQMASPTLPESPAMAHSPPLPPIPEIVSCSLFLR